MDGSRKDGGRWMEDGRMEEEISLIILRLASSELLKND